MNRKRQHIAWIALLQLTLLVTPLVVKLIHHHDFTPVSLVNTNERSVSAAREVCPICQFEFVNFLAAKSLKISRTGPSLVSVLNPTRESQIFTPTQFIWSKRAPPRLLSYS